MEVLEASKTNRIQEAWSNFRMRLIFEEDIPEWFPDCVRDAFFAGAAAYSEELKVIQQGEIAHDEAQQILDDLTGELENFVQEKGLIETGMAKADARWLAGLLEGEGCFTRGSSGTQRKLNNCARIQLSMTDKDIVEKAAALMGVKVHHRPARREGKKDLYHAEANSDRAVYVMTNILPFMGTRRGARITELIEICKRRMPLQEKIRASHRARGIYKRDERTLSLGF